MLGFFKWLGALALLLAILVGFPALLIAAVGNPWPEGGSSELALMSNSALMGILAAVGWLVWAQLLLCTLWEVPPALRRETSGAARLPAAFGGQQRLMRMLVHTVLAIGVTSTTVLGSQVVDAAAAAPPMEPVTHVTDQAPSPAAIATAPVKADPTAGHAEADLPRIVVDRGDTLWGLAEKHMGDGFRWAEIADLNKGRAMGDGHVFSDPRSMEVGWELLLPAEATNLPGDSPEREHTVAPAETLSGIALETTGDAENWPALYEANREVIGADPDLIFPGQVIIVSDSDNGSQPDAGADDATRDRPSQGESSPEAPEGPALAGGGEEPSAPGERNDTGTDGQDGHDKPQVPETPAIPVEPEQDAPAEEPSTASPGQEPRSAAGDVAEPVEEAGISALDALLASAVCLSAGALALLLHNRRRQWRWRKAGRMIASTPGDLVEVEASIIEHGAKAQKDAEFLDRALRYVAALCKLVGAPLPPLEAAVLGDEDLTLLFAEPAETEVPDGWTATDDARAWMLPRWTILDQDLETQPPPYPALVSVGLDEGGHTWYLDLETVGMCGIGGEPQQVADLARFMVAELAVNRWAEGCEVLLADDFAVETARLNPARLRQVTRDDALARAAALTSEMGEVEQNLDADLLTRRRDGLLLDTVSPVVVVVSSRPTDEFVCGVEARDRSRVVVLHGDEESPSVELTGDGMAFLPKWRVSVKAFSLPAEDAAPMADLMRSTRNLNDEPIPDMASDDGPLGKYARADGSLRDEYTAPRHTEGNDPSSQLPEADAVYLATAATTVEDLAAIAPSIPEEVRQEIAGLDPTLDQDLADWYDENSPRPKVHLLGAVEVTTLAGGDRAAIHTLAGTVSFIAYLAWLDKGVTGERAASDCGWTTVRTVQNRAKDARFLLGKRPDGTNWLPDAGLSTGAVRGATPTYELVKGLGGVITSADLFIRLRNRAARRGDADGFEEDLVQALALVTGAPFEGATERLFKWLLKTGRPDDILAGAIHDAAHTLATRAVTDGRTDLVRLACEAARRANPNGDISWLDQAAATEAESGRTAAGALVREQVLDRFDEDLPDRSETIVDQREWGAAG